MHALEAIFTRRSIRKYRQEPVPEEIVLTLIRAAMAAPTARNLQPWAFVVINERTILDTIAAAHPYGKMLHDAPLAILVCADTTKQPLEGYWLQDCSAATQNILLAAHALGLGACWVGVQPRPEREQMLRTVLKLPDFIKPVALVALGWPAEKKAPSDRFDVERIFWNKWGQR